MSRGFLGRVFCWPCRLWSGRGQGGISVKEGGKAGGGTEMSRPGSWQTRRQARRIMSRGTSRDHVTRDAKEGSPRSPP